jgi:hypothetical protein
MKEKILIGAVAIFGALTLFNTYQIMDGNGSNNNAKSKITANRADKRSEKVKENAKNKQNNPNFDPISSQNKNVPAGPKTSMSFEKLDHDFGTIAQNSSNDYVFTFTNTGKEPLIITNAKGSCGCTVPRWPKEPIAPGATGEIEIIYKPGKQKNQQTKSITVTANTEPEKTVLKIKANVLVADS